LHGAYGCNGTVAPFSRAFAYDFDKDVSFFTRPISSWVSMPCPFATADWPKKAEEVNALAGKIHVEECTVYGVSS
jgi:hypothetical protein